MSRPIAAYWNREALEMVGRAVRVARIRAGMSQRTLEARSGVDQTAISRLERGLRPQMGVEKFARIALVLGHYLWAHDLFTSDDPGLMPDARNGLRRVPSSSTISPPEWWMRQAGLTPD
jgi:transcriptional regulator with XRE-family HTH domain